MTDLSLLAHRMNRKRTMPHPWIDPNSCRSLAVLVESVSAPLLMQHAAPICLEVDIDHAIGLPADPAATAELIRTLVGQALGTMPEGGDLMITGCDTPRGVELEMADSGADVEQRIRRLPLAAAAVGAEIHWQNCPQGGGAVTVRFPPRAEPRRMAA